MTAAIDLACLAHEATLNSSLPRLVDVVGEEFFAPSNHW